MRWSRALIAWLAIVDTTAPVNCRASAFTPRRSHCRWSFSSCTAAAFSPAILISVMLSMSAPYSATTTGGEMTCSNTMRPETAFASTTACATTPGVAREKSTGTRMVFMR